MQDGASLKVVTALLMLHGGTVIVDMIVVNMGEDTEISAVVMVWFAGDKVIVVSMGLLVEATVAEKSVTAVDSWPGVELTEMLLSWVVVRVEAEVEFSILVFFKLLCVDSH